MTSPLKVSVRRTLGGLAAACSLVALLAALAGPTQAQSPNAPQPGQPKAPPPPAEKAIPPNEVAPAQPPGARPVVPQVRSDGARPLDKVPQTAEEKRRQLADLYAQLAAAESEEDANKLTESIERLWRLSGSDTVNLLINRAAKVTAEKRTELAEKLLDRAVALAPDYTEGFSQRAFFHFSQSNMTAALGDLRRVLALDPNHYKAMEGIVQIWRETGNKKGAYEVLKQLLDVNPFAPGARQAYDELKREVEGRGI
jgi:tetratricopeptide (TPR) repeat protein